MTLAELQCLFLDCQTTGATPFQGNILEFAWCIGSALEDRLPEVFSHLLEQPEDEPVPFQIQRLTGITDHEMEGAVCPSIAFEEFQGAIDVLPHPRLSVIHYARFETPFFIDLFECYGGGGTIPFQTICTFEIARRLYPNLPSRGIRALGGFLGLDMEEVKRSLSHVEATVAIWKHLVGKLGDHGISNLAELDEFLKAPAKVKRTKLEYPLERLKRLNLPDQPGVYRMLNRSGRVLYVGKATSLKSRVNSHFRGRRRKTTRSFELLTQVDEINFTACRSPLESALLESDEIKRFDPPYNSSLKAGLRTLSFYSKDLQSVELQPDAVHTIGPMPNPYSIETLVRLSHGIEFGVIDGAVLWDRVEPEVLVDGLQIFFDNHGITVGDQISPRQLLALGLRLFRTTRRELRIEEARQRLERERLAAEEAERQLLAQVSAEESRDNDVAVVEKIKDESSLQKNSMSDNGDPLNDSGELDTDDSGDDDELTPEEVAEKLDSTLISIARSYLISKELTSLLNCDIDYEYSKVTMNLHIRNSRVFLDEKLQHLLSADGLSSYFAGAERSFNESSRSSGHCSEISLESQFAQPTIGTPDGSSWNGLDITEYDRMRVLLTELMRMMEAHERISVVPRLRLLSGWQTSV